MLKSVNLDDKYSLDQGRVLMTGIQALVRLPLLQKQMDEKAGLNTAGFISGYRGSPLGGVDQALWKAEAHLQAHNIVFKSGVNEDLAATAVWGTQQLGLSKGARYQGVFSYWYGKGPGVDRSLDVIKHANAAGTARYGGVLAITGDDHACKSSTFPHQSEQAYMAAMVPVLHAASVQDILDLGLHGWAMSRFSGCWVALKMVSDIADSTRLVEIDPTRVNPIFPEPFTDLSLRWPDPPPQQEERLIRQKIPAAIAYARANKIDKITIVSTTETTRLGIIASGKSYMDVLQALDELGLTTEDAAALGLSLYKVAMPWPLEPEGIKTFASTTNSLFIVEEKRALIDPQIKDILYNSPHQPQIIGKTDLSGAPLLPEHGELFSFRLAVIIGQQLLALGAPPWLQERIDKLLAAQPEALQELIERKPHYCSGCPHNSSTLVPDGSRALGGIGCHYMALWMERHTETFSQMGGEGVAWVGTAPFTDEPHIFANLGDGTYFHSGLMAIRAAVAGKVNITYKILYNDAVAMTGGQPVDGTLSVLDITRQIAAEGVRPIVVVTDDVRKYSQPFADDVRCVERDQLDAIQRELREVKGVSALIYDQTCAAEKRRRRKRNKMVDPARRVVINELVCEGCGDCSKKSNCLSVIPLDTEWGRKRTIDQSSCNKDFSCLKGFCPSFVMLEGARLKAPETLKINPLPPAPLPTLPPFKTTWNILITGIGGTGIITIGALLAMAAHLDGKAASVLDQTGLAQKGGAVYSHVRLAHTPEALHGVRLAGTSADVIVAGDLVVGSSKEGLSYTHNERTAVILNLHETIVADFTRNPDSKAPLPALLERLQKRVKSVHHIDATQIATLLFGDTIATNLFLLGYAYQKGLIPLSIDAIEQAIHLNDTQVDMNIAAFHAGRSTAQDATAVLALIRPHLLGETHLPPATQSAEIFERRYAFLTDYQNKAYAERYKQLIEAVTMAEKAAGLDDQLSQAVMKSAFKLMAYKDEYEVARLQTDRRFWAHVRDNFSGDYKPVFYLAPPFFAKRDAITGLPLKQAYGAWILPVFRLLARLKILRGTVFDPFGYQAERKTERSLRDAYETRIKALLPHLSPTTQATIIKIAALPMTIKGFGHVKDKAIKEADVTLAALMAELSE